MGRDASAAACRCSSHVWSRAARAQDDGHDLFRTGKYQEAIALLSKVPASDSDWVAAQRDLVRAYATIGKYDEAERVAPRDVAKGGSALWNPLGEVLLMRGKRAAAESAFVRAGAEHAPDSLTAALNLAVLHYDRGERDRAMKEFDHFIDVYNASAGADLSQRRPRRRRDRGRVPRRERSAAVQGCAEGVRPRAADRSDQRRRKGQARRAVPAEIQLRRRAEDVRRRPSDESRTIRARCSARRGDCRRTDRRAATRCFARR